jgi:hypothetical protein
MSDDIADILRQAESLWKASRCKEALAQYDLALSLTLDNESKQGEIFLGRGYAILNSQDPDVATDVELRRDAVNNLKSAKAISIKLGNTRAANFVQQIIDKEGKLHVHGHDHGHDGSKSSGTCCSTTQEQVEGSTEKVKERECSEHDVVARAAATRAAEMTNTESKRGDSGVWTEEADERLISLVAKLGVGKWEEMSLAIKDYGEVGNILLSVEQIKGRWNYLKPFVKHEFEHGQGMDKERKCGHSCGTCPTRVSCQLHAAIDIEDLC